MKIKGLVNKYKFLIVILGLFVFLMLTKSSFAKYNSNENKDFLYEASSFYFTSNALNNNSSVTVYTLATGTDYIEFNVANNEDNLRYSEVDIDYEVTITDINGNNVVDKNNNGINKINGILAKNAINSNTHRFSNLLDGAYIVTATSLSPYSKTVRANFIINNSNRGLGYSITDAVNSPILQLIISTNDYSGNVNILWPRGITPDNTIPVFSFSRTGFNSSNITIAVEKNGEYIYQFFKQNPSNVYRASDFTIGGVV